MIKGKELYNLLDLFNNSSWDIEQVKFLYNHIEYPYVNMDQLEEKMNYLISITETKNDYTLDKSSLIRTFKNKYGHHPIFEEIQEFDQEKCYIALKGALVFSKDLSYNLNYKEICTFSYDQLIDFKFSNPLFKGFNYRIINVHTFEEFRNESTDPNKVPGIKNYGNKFLIESIINSLENHIKYAESNTFIDLNLLLLEYNSQKYYLVDAIRECVQLFKVALADEKNRTRNIIISNSFDQSIYKSITNVTNYSDQDIDFIHEKMFGLLNQIQKNMIY